MMYARLMRFTFSQDVTHDEAHALYQDLIAECRHLGGFCGCSFMLMPSERRGMALIYWADAECATAAGQRIMPVMISRMSDVLAEAPEISGYEVIEHSIMDPHAEITQTG